jgi:hypothetical protein
VSDLGLQENGQEREVQQSEEHVDLKQEDLKQEGERGGKRNKKLLEECISTLTVLDLALSGGDLKLMALKQPEQ